MDQEMMDKASKLFIEYLDGPEIHLKNQVWNAFTLFLVTKIIELENKIEHLEYGGENI